MSLRFSVVISALLVYALTLLLQHRGFLTPASSHGSSCLAQSSVCWDLVWILLSCFSRAFLSCLDILISIWAPLSRFWKLLVSPSCTQRWILLHAGVTACVLSVGLIRHGVEPSFWSFSSRLALPCVPSQLYSIPCPAERSKACRHYFLWVSMRVQMHYKKGKAVNAFSHGGTGFCFSFCCQSSYSSK